MFVEHPAALAASSAAPEGAPLDGEVFMITGFTTGPAADRVAAMGEDAAVRAMVSQLDDIFRIMTGAERACSSAFIEGAMFEWAKQPFVRGGYSHGSVHELPTTRIEMAAPVGKHLFFAGEHTNHHSSLTMHGAVESGIRAAFEVLSFNGQGHRAAAFRYELPYAFQSPDQPAAHPPLKTREPLHLTQEERAARMHSEEHAPAHSPLFCEEAGWQRPKL